MKAIGDFDADRPLILDEIRGLRAFQISPNKKLMGRTVHQEWDTDENVAFCARTNPIPMMTPSWDQSEHRAGSAHCQCGFWAYFDGSNDYASTDSVTAIIAGRGLVTVGSRGFRAERARLLAIIDPWGRTNRKRTLFEKVRGFIAVRPNWTFWLASFVWIWLATWLAAVLPFSTVIEGLMVGVIGPLTGFAITVLLHPGEVHTGKYTELSKQEFDQMLKNYPGVPVYETVAAAVKDFPLYKRGDDF